MTTEIRVFACCLLAIGLLGCNETSPPATESTNHQTQREVPQAEFKLSPEALSRLKAERDVAADEVAEAEIPPAKPRRKTIVESLFQAVRNGAAEAVDESSVEN